MIKNKAIDILKSLSESELKKFEEFIMSPYHNKNRNIVKLIRLLKRYAPGYDKEWLTKRRLYKILFSDKPYNDQIYRNLMSEMLRVSENFLAQQNYDNEQSFYKNVSLITEKCLRDADVILSNEASSEITHDQFFYKRFLIQLIKNEYNLLKADTPFLPINTIKESEYLICFFVINLVRLKQNSLSDMSLFTGEIQFNLLEEFLRNFNLDELMNRLEKSSFEFYPVFSLYFYMLKSRMDHRDNISYLRFKEILNNYIRIFSKAEKHNIYAFIENTCTLKINSGFEIQKNRLELFEIYNRRLNENIFTSKEDEYFDPTMFLNIVTGGIAVGEYDWTEKFISAHIHRLHPSNKMNLYYYSLAYLNFARRNFNKALENLVNVKYSYFIFKIDVKRLLIQIYYELSEYDFVLSVMDTYKHFLSKEKTLSNEIKMMSNNFIGIVNRLVRIQLGSLHYNSEQLRQEIINSKAESQGWLLEKAKELCSSR
jgi:hypothetical protein